MTTGGTIEKTYDEFDGSLENRESSIKSHLEKKLRLPYVDIQVVSIMSKDSLHMTDYDRTMILKFLKMHIEKMKPIIVFHGTDTMAKTATYIYNEIKNPAVPIIFTGAMKPIGFDDSDAIQNSTEAILAANLLEPGVYISFHSRVFKLPNVRKNKERRTFESF